MIETKPIPADYEEYVYVPEEEIMPEVKPGMLCLMDETISSADVVPGQLATIKKGTPIKIRTVDFETRTVTAEDYQGRVWTFVEPEPDFGDIDYYFHPLTKEDVATINDTKKFTRHAKSADIADNKNPSFLAVGMISAGFLAACVPTFLSLEGVLKSIFSVLAIVILSTASVLFCWSVFRPFKHMPTAFIAFSKDYEQNLKELNAILQRSPIYYTSENSDD